METLRYVVLVNGLLAVLIVAYYILLRRETFFGANRLMLWLIVAVSFAGPLLELPDWRPQPVRDVMQRTARVIVPRVLPSRVNSQPDVTITFPNGKTYPAAKNVPTSAGWPWQQVLIVVYMLGLVCLLIRLVLQVVSLYRLVQRSVLERYDDFTVVRNESIKAPFSFFNQVFINPLQHTPDELEQILRHERVHVRAWHSLDMLAAELVCIVLWFNPVAHLFRHLLRQTLEFSADRAVLAEGVDVRAYQYNLLKVSMGPEKLAFTNQFSGSTLRERVDMINGQRSNSSAWWRYLMGSALVGIAALACQHHKTDVGETFTRHIKSPLPLTNATRMLAAELDKEGMPWFRQSMLLEGKLPDATRINGRVVQRISFESYPEWLCLKNNRLAIKYYGSDRKEIFINGQKASVPALTKITFEEVDDLLTYQKWADMPGADRFPELYRVFISTTHKPPRPTRKRMKWKQFLLANAVSNYPLGNSSTFSMNKLLEATFFNDKRAFVKRTQDNHLQLYDDYAADSELYINGIAASKEDIAGIHVREVDKLYTRERSFDEWIDGPDRKHRFVLYVQTSPKRANRDSTYYVFSPFYTGDF